VRAAVARDGQLEVGQVPEPSPGKGELLVRVRAAGLNAADLLQLKGLYPAPPDSPPDVLGLELAGVVVATGPGARRFSAGDRVMAVVGGGGQAELAVVHERLAVPVPAGMGWAEAGGFPEAFTTAHDALFSQCRLGLGEHLLVHGAAGGVGVAAVQLGRAAGARVTATVRHQELRPEVEALGAHAAVDPEAFGALGPFDVVLELVGGPNLAADLEGLAPRGRIAVIGIGAGAAAQLDLRQLMAKRATLSGSTLRARSLEDKASAAREVEAHVLPLVASGSLRVPVCARFPLALAQAAYDRFAAGAKLGKVVLLMEGP
jgi:NADPH2:quinone reductase